MNKKRGFLYLFLFFLGVSFFSLHTYASEPNFLLELKRTYRDFQMKREEASIPLDQNSEAHHRYQQLRKQFGLYKKTLEVTLGEGRLSKKKAQEKILEYIEMARIDHQLLFLLYDRSPTYLRGL